MLLFYEVCEKKVYDKRDLLNFQPHRLNRKYYECVCGGIKVAIVNILLGPLSPCSWQRINTAATNPERPIFPLPVNGNYLQLTELSLKRAELELRKGVQAFGTTLHNYVLKVNCEER
jgi:hypothetical protein